MEKTLFKEQVNGYDKEQVDNYIRKITEAYQANYNEYLALCEKYNGLVQDYKELEAKKQQAGIDADVIAKALINSEKMAKEIIDNAHSEESRIIDLTVKNLQYAYATLETAMHEVQKFLTFNNAEAQKFLTGATVEEKRRNIETEGVSDADEIQKFE